MFIRSKSQRERQIMCKRCIMFNVDCCVQCTGE